jgi:isopentenyl diphosphate isomerase/L-lactate dehydrogenase-like FMN-dependent dehydrogenase
VRILRRRWPGPLIVKGVLRADDALRACELGADGVVVSNHGARNFDSALASIDALPAIADAVGDRVTVLLDSGVRRGTDIAKALALGAQGVMVGRPVLFGLAAGGQAGAQRSLQLLGAEFDRALAYLGCSRCDELGPHLVASPGSRAATDPAMREAP